MRYQAPQHTSAVYAPSRQYRADEHGVIKVPDNAPDCDHAAMRAVGCVPLPEQDPGGAEVPAKGKPKA